ncbi:cell death regulator Aven-like [Lytechinus variegatus]|uniref:cell death regulator Aven-like n=1 Tax=Lytechinus variegatus TaxID=7654 RepID=UPI001BB1F87C|nr:cell death regulator Aven-like [Lytechinus variegatus]
MKKDKHKAKRSANYKKQHGISSAKNANRTAKSTIAAEAEATLRHIVKPKGHGVKSQSELIIEKQEELKQYSRRKVESNWEKYEDFVVDPDTETEKVRSEPRGEDFQKLLSKSDDASSQLRMKDEVWWDGDDQDDETETEIGKLFKIDYVDLARRLKCIPLHERLGISTKYFDEDLLNKINEDAAEHTKRYQEMLDAEKAQELNNPQESENPTPSDTVSDLSSRELMTEPTVGACINSCEANKLHEVTDEHCNQQSSDVTLRTNNETEHCTKDVKQTDSQSADRLSHSAVSPSSRSHIDSGSPVTSSDRSTKSADDKEPTTEPHAKHSEEENLENWLDDFLDD